MRLESAEGGGELYGDTGNKSGCRIINVALQVFDTDFFWSMEDGGMSFESGTILFKNRIFLLKDDLNDSPYTSFSSLAKYASIGT